MTVISTTNPVGKPATPSARAAASSASPSRSWAWAGALAGLAATVAFMVTSGIAPNDEALFADNALLAEELLDGEMIVWLWQVLSTGAALGVAIFATGLRRRLAAQAPAESMVPTLAAAGLASVAIMLLVGGGISTELFWALMQDSGKADPDTIAANLGIFNTMGWVWAGIGLTTGSVALTALRHGALPRWLGWVSAVATVLIALTQVVPLQYMAAFVGAPWLIVAGIGLARSERTA